MNRVNVPNPKVYHLPNWNRLTEPQKLDVIKDICLKYGRDPRVATQAVSILRQANIAPRDYVGQAACLLKWVQNYIYYVESDCRTLYTQLKNDMVIVMIWQLYYVLSLKPSIFPGN